jgi:predicted regulator of Ras-like GTPase activity (Roadblock/LC7/MglB family)
VHVLNEPMTSASSVWNAMLGMWNHVKTQPAWQPPEAVLGMADYPIKVAELQGAGEPAPRPSPAAAAVRSAGRPVMRVSHPALDASRAHDALADMLSVEGLLGCAVVDGTTGLVLARETRELQPADLELSAAASAQVLRSHKAAARSMGLAEQIDEVIVSAGARQQVLRPLPRHPDLFLMALLDRSRSNLALARYKMTEAEKGLA